MRGPVTRQDYSNIIYSHRDNRELDDAISICIEATQKYPSDSFFFGLLGDLYMQNSSFNNASNAYLENLKRLHNKSRRFRNFSKFYKRLKARNEQAFLTTYHSAIADAIQHDEIQPAIVSQLYELIGDNRFASSELRQVMLWLKDDQNLDSLQAIIENAIYIGNTALLKLTVSYYLNEPYSNKQSKTNIYLVKQAENQGWFDKALQLIEKAPNYLRNPLSIRSILRICRKKKNYSYAEEKLQLDREYIAKSKFNVLYELTYYFDHKNNNELLNFTLQKMRDAAGGSEPIARTLYNFYLRFNMLDEADKISEHIKRLASSRRVDKNKKHLFINPDQEEALSEAQMELANMLSALFVEVEHTRRMIALRDLIKGFSHELGQPITSAIQYSYIK